MEAVTVKQIHSAFDEAAEALLVMPEDITIQEDKEALARKAERLKKLGFSRCDEVVRLENFDRNREVKQKLLEGRRVVHGFAKKYREKYPNLKFITKLQVNELCRKYNLVAKVASEYIGDIPEQKLFEMECWVDEIDEADLPDIKFNYEIREEMGDSFYSLPDRTPIQMLAEISFRRSVTYVSYGREPLSESEAREKLMEENEKKPFNRVRAEDMQEGKIEISKDDSARHLRIAAPESMFMESLSKNLAPIVLQPVKGGYLVIAKWGEEVNDPALTVPELN
jgi:hypothetical protein